MVGQNPKLHDEEQHVFVLEMSSFCVNVLVL